VPSGGTQHGRKKSQEKRGCINRDSGKGRVRPGKRQGKKGPLLLECLQDTREGGENGNLIGKENRHRGGGVGRNHWGRKQQKQRQQKNREVYDDQRAIHGRLESLGKRKKKSGEQRKGNWSHLRDQDRGFPIPGDGKRREKREGNKVATVWGFGDKSRRPGKGDGRTRLVMTK